MHAYHTIVLKHDPIMHTIVLEHDPSCTHTIVLKHDCTLKHDDFTSCTA